MSAAIDRRGAGIDRRDRLRRRVARRRRESGAEDRVDDHPRSFERRGHLRAAELADGAVEALEVRGGVRRQLGGRPQQQDLDAVAELGEATSGDEPVAAVVSLAADDANRAVAGDLLAGLCDRQAGGLHQGQRRHAPLLDRPRIGGTHRLGVVEGVEPALAHGNQAGRAATTAAAISREWLSETSSASPSRRAASAALP